MIVGLYDADRQNNKSNIPNLELMKYSHYYASKNTICSLSPRFDPDRYSKLIFRQDFSEKLPDQFSRFNNIECGGLAFTDNVYYPMTEDLEETLPNTFLYDNINKQSRFNTLMRRGTHLRFSLDNKTIWKNWEKPAPINNDKHIIICHDYNPSKIEGCRELIKDIQKETNKTIFFKYPLVLESSTELIKWSSLKINDFSPPILFKGILSEEGMEYIVNQDNSFCKLFQFDFSDIEYLVSNFHIIYQQLWFLNMTNNNFSLRNTWLKNYPKLSYFFRILQRYFRFLKKHNCRWSFVDYVRTLKKKERDQIKPVLSYFRQVNYDFFKLLYEYRG